MALMAGEWVEVRSKEEILQTLDQNGRLEGMPFTPQMFNYCGKRFRVYKRAHKTCDPIYTMASRSLPNGVHLNLRCDGKAYGGCDVGCLLFWKDAWLKLGPADPGASATIEHAGPTTNPGKVAVCTEEDVWKATRVGGGKDGPDTQYTCQTTELPKYTKALPWWSPAQYVEDYKSGNVTLDAMLRGALYSVFVRYPTRLYPFRAIYNAFQALIGGKPSPVNWGLIPVGKPQPSADYHLQPGDLVRIKTHDEIRATLDRRNKNKGLYFDVEMVPFCGGIYRVRSRIGRFIDEKTGRMKSLKTPAVILEGVFCQSKFSKRRMYCPRGLHSWWREVWLDRVSESEIGTEAKPCIAKQLQATARFSEVARRQQDEKAPAGETDLVSGNRLLATQERSGPIGVSTKPPQSAF
jgi:hypothetical protein